MTLRAKRGIQARGEIVEKERKRLAQDKANRESDLEGADRERESVLRLIEVLEPCRRAGDSNSALSIDRLRQFMEEAHEARVRSEEYWENRIAMAKDRQVEIMLGEPGTSGAAEEIQEEDIGRMTCSASVTSSLSSGSSDSSVEALTRRIKELEAQVERSRSEGEVEKVHRQLEAPTPTGRDVNQPFGGAAPSEHGAGRKGVVQTPSQVWQHPVRQAVPPLRVVADEREFEVPEGVQREQEPMRFQEVTQVREWVHLEELTPKGVKEFKAEILGLNLRTPGGLPVSQRTARVRQAVWKRLAFVFCMFYRKAGIEMSNELEWQYCSHQQFFAVLKHFTEDKELDICTDIMDKLKGTKIPSFTEAKLMDSMITWAVELLELEELYFRNRNPVGDIERTKIERQWVRGLNEHWKRKSGDKGDAAWPILHRIFADVHEGGYEEFRTLLEYTQYVSMMVQEVLSTRKRMKRYEHTGAPRQFENPKKKLGADESNPYKGKTQAGRLMQKGGDPAWKQKSTNPPVGTRKECRGCGRKGHTAEECRKKDHPDWNHSRDPWGQSTSGKAWAAKGHEQLPFGFQLNGTRLPARKTHEGECAQCMSVCNSTLVDTNNALSRVDVYARSHASTKRICMRNANLLIDTGSNPYSFVNRRIRERVVNMGAKVKHLANPVPVTVGGTLKVHVTEQVSISLKIRNPLVNKVVEVELQALVLDSKYDVIVGLYELKRHPILKMVLFSNLVTLEDLEWFGAHVIQSGQQTDPDVHGLMPHVVPIPIREEGNGNHLYQRAELEMSPGLDADAEFDLRGELTGGRDGDTARELPGLPTSILGSQRQVDRQRELCKRYTSVFQGTLSRTPAKVPPMEIRVDEAAWGSSENRRPPRPQGRERQEEIREQTRTMLEAGVIRQSVAPSHSQVLLVRKPNGSWRFCVDFRRLNIVSEVENWPIPNIKEMLQRIGKRRPKFMACLDMTKGYWQAPVAEASRKYTAFITYEGVFEFNRVAMGLKGAPAYFQRVMSSVVLAGLVYTACEVYMDDVIVLGDTEEQYMENLEKVLKRLSVYGLTANPAKCKLGVQEIEFVGHKISSEGISFTRERLHEFVKFPRPETRGELMEFLGKANYFRDHIPSYGRVDEPLRNFLMEGGPYSKKDRKEKLKWNKRREEAFDEMLVAINGCVELFFVGERGAIHLYTDASDWGVGAWLVQEVDSVMKPIGLHSKSFNATQKGWSTIEKEAFAIVSAVHKFDYLLRGAKFTVHTDHRNLQYIKDAGSQKVWRWKNELQEYCFDVRHIPGEQNVIADLLSRNTAATELVNRPEDIAEVRENFFTDEVTTGVEQLVLESQEDFQNCEAMLEMREEFHIPDKEWQTIAKVHNAQMGHTGVVNTIRRLKEKGLYTSKMRQMVKEFIKKCDTCQKLEQRAREVNTQPYTTGGMRLFERINVDTIGPFKEDEDGNKYVVVIVDSLSRFVELIPTDTADGKAAGRALMQHVGYFGLPKQVLTDNGPQYRNEAIKELTSAMGVQALYTTPYSKEENGLVERMNKEVNRFLRGLIMDREDIRWNLNLKLHLPMVMRIINSTFKKATGCSPSEMVFGRQVDLDACIVVPVENQSGDEDQPVTDWVQQAHEMQQQLIMRAYQMQQQREGEHAAAVQSRQSGKPLTEFAVDDWVYVDRIKSVGGNDVPSKLRAERTGPHRISAKLSDRAYEVEDSTTKRRKKVDVSRVRKANIDILRNNPSELAQKDSNEYELEKVLGHHNSLKFLSRVTFTCKWVGYDEVTEEPWENVRANAICNRA